MYTGEEALALIMDCWLSKADYQTICIGAVFNGNNLYPTYNEVREEKDLCIPHCGIQTTDYSASVDLQSLIDHTTYRLFKILNKSVKAAEKSILVFIHKVGFDGSTGQSLYKTSTEDKISISYVEEQSLFLSCIVPIKLYIEESGELLWTNEKPSSTLYCRPVRFQYVKESADVIIQEYNYFKNSSLK